MIIAVTPNPAWDVTYRVDRLRQGHSHRVDDVTRRAGGKGVNVASVLTHRGRDVTVVAPCGGAVGDLFAADLRARGVAAELVPGTDLRTSVAVVTSGEATLFNEAGLVQPETVWERLLDTVAGMADAADALAVSGSLPTGAPDDLLRRLVRVGVDAGLPVVLDSQGPALTAALSARPTLVKPNRLEAARTTGDTDPLTAARHLVSSGAGTAVVSSGAEGLVLAGPDGLALRAYCSAWLDGNPTGAGDALAAALTAFLADSHRTGAPPGPAGWREALREGVAWAGAAVLAPVAGDVDTADVERVRRSAVVEDVPLPG